jgi:hypothetical protein
MDPLAIFQTAISDQNAGRLTAAEIGYRAILDEVQHLPSMHNLAIILAHTGRLDEAGETYRRAAEAAPDNPRSQEALAHHLRETRQLGAAEAAYRRTLELKPDSRSTSFDLGCVLLAQMQFEEGWRRYEGRRARNYVLGQHLRLPEWRGEPLEHKRLFVWREQGYGDQIMMARFLPRLGAAAITYVGPLGLERLFAPMPVQFMRMTPGGRMDLGGYDYWTLPFSLPQHLVITPKNAWTGPYLTGRARPVGGRIGLVWRGEPGNRNDSFRSLPSALAAELLSLPGVVSLDPADTGAADFQDTADIIAGLDLVISVDTATAHLAGAMGHPLWVMLAQHALDWHWPREGVSPWYPQARLFVQPSPGDWAGVIAAVRRELAAQGLS